MFTLEDKINIVLAYIATDDKTLRKKLKSMAVEAVKGIEVSPEPAPVHPAVAKLPFDMDGLIMDHLKQCGMPPHLLGHDYMVTAIKLCLNDPEYLRDITYRLYPDIASQHNTTPSRTERVLRHAVEVCFDRGGGLDYILQVFGNTVDINRGKLTNSEFIAGSVNAIERMMK
jgi:two-component system response regulator (stage 0 sporulation protein A)